MSEDKKDLKNIIKDVNKIVKEYNPIDNEIELGEDATIKWKLDPKIKLSENPFEDIDKTKFDIKITDNLSERVEMSLKIKGNFSDIEKLAAKLEFKVKI
jgi:hypothetical protein